MTGSAGSEAPRGPRATFSPYYRGFWGGRAFRWIDWQKTRLLRDLLRGRPGHHLALDLGCGAGAVSGRLTQTGVGLTVVGVDHDPSLLRIARGAGVAAVCADFDRPLPFAAGSFDYVVMADTIEHIEDPRRALREVLRLMKADGLFVVFTPPYDSIAWVAAEKVHRFVTRRTADHISPFTREALSFLLDRHFVEWRVGTLNAGLTMYGVASVARA